MNRFDQRLTPLLDTENGTFFGIIALTVPGTSQLLKTLLEAQLPQGNIDGVNEVWINSPLGKYYYSLDGLEGANPADLLFNRESELLWLRNRDQIEACSLALPAGTLIVQLFTGSQGTTK